MGQQGVVWTQPTTEKNRIVSLRCPPIVFFFHLPAAHPSRSLHFQPITHLLLDMPRKEIFITLLSSYGFSSKTDLKEIGYPSSMNLVYLRLSTDVSKIPTAVRNSIEPDQPSCILAHSPILMPVPVPVCVWVFYGSVTTVVIHLSVFGPSVDQSAQLLHTCLCPDLL